jgi:hypothetical protein
MAQEIVFLMPRRGTKGFGSWRLDEKELGPLKGAPSRDPLPRLSGNSPINAGNNFPLNPSPLSKSLNAVDLGLVEAVPESSEVSDYRMSNSAVLP